jgi:hypothetical protein
MLMIRQASNAAGNWVAKMDSKSLDTYSNTSKPAAFINVNNVSSQRYLGYCNCPVLPIQFLAVITARF